MLWFQHFFEPRNFRWQEKGENHLLAVKQSSFFLMFVVPKKSTTKHEIFQNCPLKKLVFKSWPTKGEPLGNDFEAKANRAREKLHLFLAFKKNMKRMSLFSLTLKIKNWRKVENLGQHNLLHLKNQHPSFEEVSQLIYCFFLSCKFENNIKLNGRIST